MVVHPSAFSIWPGLLGLLGVAVSCPKEQGERVWCHKSKSLGLGGVRAPGASYSGVSVSVGDTYTYVHIRTHTYTYVHIIIARRKAPHCTKFERGWEVTSTVRESSGESPTS